MSFLFHWFLFVATIFVFSFPITHYQTSPAACVAIHIWLRNAYSLHLSLSLDKCRSFTRRISASMRAHHKLFTWINEGNKYLFSLNEIYWSVSFVRSFFLLTALLLMRFSSTSVTLSLPLPSSRSLLPSILSMPSNSSLDEFHLLFS